MRKGTCVIASLAFLLVTGCGGSGNGQESGGTNTVTVKLEEQNESGESGTATLSKAGEGQTRVMIELKNPRANPVAQPAHIHEGSCDDLNPVPEYSLMNAGSGTSETTVPVSLDELKDGAYAINVHMSPSDLETYVACGDIGSGEGDGDGGGGEGY